MFFYSLHTFRHLYKRFQNPSCFFSFSISVQGVSLPIPIEPSALIVLSGNPGTNQIRIPAPFPPKREEEQL